MFDSNLIYVPREAHCITAVMVLQLMTAVSGSNTACKVSSDNPDDKQRQEDQQHATFCGAWWRSRGFNWAALLEFSSVNKAAVAVQVCKRSTICAIGRKEYIIGWSIFDRSLLASKCYFWPLGRQMEGSVCVVLHGRKCMQACTMRERGRQSVSQVLGGDAIKGPD